MKEIGDVHHEDIMRAFFRSRVSEVGKLVKQVAEVAMRAPAESGIHLEQLLPEINQIVLVSYTAANHVIC